MSDEQHGSQADGQLVLCPYCGHAQYGGDRCQVCSGLFEPLSRRATQLAMGPWQVRDKQNPFKPGCSYDIIKRMAAAGKIKSTTVVRGPTTKQFWSIARNVPGVAHLIGYCHACGTHVSPTDAKCGTCGAAFVEPRERNKLGLAYKTDEDVKRGQAALDAELRGEASAMPLARRETAGPTKRMPPKPAKPGDLLAEVLDLSQDSSQPIQTARKSSASTGKPLEFASSGYESGQYQIPASAFDVDPTGPIPDSKTISPIVLALVALNIIALGAIVAFVLLR